MEKSKVADRRAGAALILVCMCLAAGPGGAQTTAVSQISGVVQDATGAAIPGVEVKATQANTGLTRSVLSAADGRYTLANLPVGPYQLHVSGAGFTPYAQKGIVLQVNTNPEINPVLQVGSVSEQVEVTADAAMAETHDNSVSQVIDQRRIEDLPLNGRQPTQLILLSGGAAAAPPGGDINTSKNYSTSSVTISIAGGQVNGVNYLMDGGDNNDAFSNVNLPFPFPDALQEFSVQTSAVPARYGLHPGGVVNLITRSGGNRWHGDLFEFLRNGVFNARNFFAPAVDTLKRNQFGGTLGGPILHDRLFFFMGYQGTRNRSDPATTISYVPNQSILSGDFSTLVSSACTSKPVTLGKPFVNNRISPALFNPQALALAKYLPLSTDPCGKVQYGIPNNGDEDQVIGRVDYNRGERQQIFGRYFISDYRNDPVFDGTNALTTTKAGVHPRSQSLALSDTYSFGPGLISSFHATGNLLRIRRGAAANFLTPGSVGIQINDQVPAFITLTTTNFFGLGCGTCAPGKFNRAALQLAEDIDLIRGSHQIAFGVNFIHNQLNDVSNNLSNGLFTFNGGLTGNGLADFLTGQPSDFQQSNPQQENELQNYFGLYVQDSWKVSRRFTVNLGLRWEPYFPVYDIYNRGSHFELSDFLANKRSPQFTNAPAGVVFHGDPGFPKSNTFRSLNNWAPRIGVIADPRGDGRETIRVSYGILYDSPEIYYNIRFASAPPFGNSIDIPNPAGGLTTPYQGFSGGNPFPQPFPPPKNVVFPNNGIWVNLPLHIHPMYLQQWNLSYQRQLGGNWLVTANYLGNKTTHIWMGTEANPAVLAPGATVGNTNARRVLTLLDASKGAPFGSITQTDDGGNAHYNGMLLSAQHRFSHNFTALVNYTLSHCLSDGDFSNDLTAATYQNPTNRRGDRANCSFDHRHIFNSSVIATTPRFDSRMLAAAASGWEISGILTAQSGGFWNVTTGRDASLTAVGMDRPNVVGDWHVPHPTFAQWFNPAAFQANAPGMYGNAGRDLILGPKTVNLDMGLMRQIPLREAYRVEVRAEAFNVLNHANINLTSTNQLHTALNDPKIGSITGAADPRILQFALKFVF